MELLDAAVLLQPGFRGRFLRWGRGIGMKKRTVRPPDEFHTSGQSQLAPDIFIYVSKQACFSILTSFSQPPMLTSGKNIYVKYVFFSQLLHWNIFKPKPILIILLAWQNIEPVHPVFTKLEVINIGIHFQGQQSHSKHIYRNRGDLPRILSALNQNSSRGLQWQLASQDKKPEKHRLPRNLRGKCLRKKWGFHEWSSLPCMIDKMVLKLSRESSVLWVSIQVAWSQQSSVLSQSPLVLAKWVCPVGFCLVWRPVGQALIYWSETRPHGSQHMCCAQDRLLGKGALVTGNGGFSIETPANLGLRYLFGKGSYRGHDWKGGVLGSNSTISV